MVQIAPVTRAAAARADPHGIEAGVGSQPEILGDHARAMSQTKAGSHASIARVNDRQRVISLPSRVTTASPSDRVRTPPGTTAAEIVLHATTSNSESAPSAPAIAT